MIDIILFGAGLVALVLGANALVRGASKLALKLGLSPLVVGLTVVAFGTSAPEMAVSAGAVLNGQTGLAVGNAVGSNIFNVLFILGVAALITPLAVSRQVIRQEVPIMIGSAVLLIVLAIDGGLGGFDGGLLMACLVGYTGFLVVQSRRETAAAAAAETPAQPVAGASSAPAGRPWDERLPLQLLLIVAGLALLVGGSQAMVTAAVSFARQLGLSEVVIGLTIVAAGTSLPEVAASLTASLKGERDIAVGNVVGSNVFNIFGVVGLSSLLAAFGEGGSLTIPPDVFRFDLWVMLAALFACLPIFMTGREIARWEGALFLGYYVAYVAWLVLKAQDRALMEPFSNAMLGFVAPLTVVTLGVSLLRRRT